MSPRSDSKPNPRSLPVAAPTDTSNVSGQPTGYLATIERTLQTSNVTYEGTETVAGQETYPLSVEPAGTLSTGEIDQTYYLDQETYVPVKTHVETTFIYDNETVTAESVPRNAAESSEPSDMSAEEEGVFSESVEIEFDGIEVPIGPPEDLDGDGTYEDVTGDGSVDSVDALAHAVVVTLVEDGEVTLTDEQADALDIDGDGNVDYEDAETLVPNDEADTRSSD